ncbi:MAG: pyridoxamine 5'-phosphate oxidase family protein [Chloroflexota bacterium]
MNERSVADARNARFLERQPIVWLSTVRPDGTPQVIPVWYWWDGEALVIFSKPHAQKVRNIRSNPAVALALGEPDDDFDVALVEARAELLDTPTAAVLPEPFLEKYANRMAAVGLDRATFAATYSQVVVVVPSRNLPWHGRTTPMSARLAAAPSRTIGEPVPAAAASFDGEPIARLPIPPASDRAPLWGPRATDRRAPRSLVPPGVGGWIGRGLQGLSGSLRPQPALAPGR